MADVFIDPTFEARVGHHIEKRLQEFKRIVATALKFSTVKDAHMPIGSSDKDLVFPAMFVEPDDFPPEMDTTYRYHLVGKLSAYCWFVGNDREKLRQQAVLCADALWLLFSNNGTGDLATSTPSNKWKSNPGFWYDSEMAFQTFRHGRYSRGNGEQLIRLVLMRFTFKDYVVM